MLLPVKKSRQRIRSTHGERSARHHFRHHLERMGYLATSRNGRWTHLIELTRRSGQLEFETLYFACRSLKYRARLSIRTRPRSWSRSTSEKTGPHEGIAPCPRRSSSPEMIRSIRINGNAPPLRAEMRVKSEGGNLSVEAAGPSPLASGP
jgi:hypothetical protein